MSSTYPVQALVLGKVPYGEKAMIVKLWTRPYGIQSYMVHSIRSGKSGMRPALLLPMTSLEALVTHRNKGQLEKMPEVRVAHLWTRLSSDPMGQALCLFSAELLLKTLRDGDSTSAFFDDVMEMLERWDQPGQSLAMATVELLTLVAHHLGFAAEPETYKEGAVYDFKEGQFASQALHHDAFLSAECSAAWMAWFKDVTHTPAKPLRQALVDGLLMGLRWQHSSMGQIYSLDILRGL